MIITTTRPKDPTTGKWTTLYHVEKDDKVPVALFSTPSLADAALVCRYLNNGTLPDEECRQARTILMGNDKPRKA